MAGEFNLAIDTLQNALNAQPKSKEAIRALGKLYVLKGDNRKAESHMKRALEENPDDLDAKADLGDLYVTMQKY